MRPNYTDLSFLSLFLSLIATTAGVCACFLVSTVSVCVCVSVLKRYCLPLSLPTPPPPPTAPTTPPLLFAVMMHNNLFPLIPVIPRPHRFYYFDVIYRFLGAATGRHWRGNCCPNRHYYAARVTRLMNGPRGGVAVAVEGWVGWREIHGLAAK